jgi:hypothetical protein
MGSITLDSSLSAWLAVRRGDFLGAIQVLKRGLDLCQTWQEVVRIPLFGAALVAENAGFCWHTSAGEMSASRAPVLVV